MTKKGIKIISDLKGTYSWLLGQERFKDAAKVRKEIQSWEKKQNTEIIILRAHIAYAIGHGQGCGHPIKYLEKRYPELTKKEKVK